MFRRTMRVPNSPCVYVIYHMLDSGSFSATCLQDISKGVLDPRLPWADTFVVRLRQPVDLVHVLKTVKGLLLLVPTRTPRSSGYDFYAHAVYVVIFDMSITCICLLYVLICYMSVKCYVSVMCLVLTILVTNWWWDLGHSSVNSLGLGAQLCKSPY
jgi:hypothetical protein